jgi:small conductance mechanosensitive channel
MAGQTTDEITSFLSFGQEIQSQKEMLAGHANLASFDVLLKMAYGIDPIYVILNIIVIVIIIFLTSSAVKVVDQMLQRYIPKVAGKVELKLDETVQVMIRRLAAASIYALGFMLVILQIPQLHSLAMAMLAGAGIAGLAIGYAAKDSLSNFTSGIFIAIFQPIRVGDSVDFQGDYGKIEDLTLRHTVIRTWDRRRIIVPNSIVSTQPIINWTIKEPEITWPVDFLIRRASDIDRSREIILQEAGRHPHILKDPKPLVLLTDAKEAKYNLRLFVRVPNRNVAYRMGCEIREAIEKRFETEGVIIGSED